MASFRSIDIVVIAHTLTTPLRVTLKNLGTNYPDTGGDRLLRPISEQSGPVSGGQIIDFVLQKVDANRYIRPEEKVATTMSLIMILLYQRQPQEAVAEEGLSVVLTDLPTFVRDKRPQFTEYDIVVCSSFHRGRALPCSSSSSLSSDSYGSSFATAESSPTNSIEWYKYCDAVIESLLTEPRLTFSLSLDEATRRALLDGFKRVPLWSVYRLLVTADANFLTSGANSLSVAPLFMMANIPVSLWPEAFNDVSWLSEKFQSKGTPLHSQLQLIGQLLELVIMPYFSSRGGYVRGHLYGESSAQNLPHPMLTVPGEQLNAACMYLGPPKDNMRLYKGLSLLFGLINQLPENLDLSQESKELTETIKQLLRQFSLKKSPYSLTPNLQQLLLAFEMFSSKLPSDCLSKEKETIRYNHLRQVQALCFYKCGGAPMGADLSPEIIKALHEYVTSMPTTWNSKWFTKQLSCVMEPESNEVGRNFADSDLWTLGELFSPSLEEVRAVLNDFGQKHAEVVASIHTITSNTLLAKQKDSIKAKKTLELKRALLVGILKKFLAFTSAVCKLPVTPENMALTISALTYRVEQFVKQFTGDAKIKFLSREIIAFERSIVTVAAVLEQSNAYSRWEVTFKKLTPAELTQLFSISPKFKELSVAIKAHQRQQAAQRALQRDRQSVHTSSVNVSVSKAIEALATKYPPNEASVVSDTLQAFVKNKEAAFRQSARQTLSGLGNEELSSLFLRATVTMPNARELMSNTYRFPTDGDAREKSLDIIIQRAQWRINYWVEPIWAELDVRSELNVRYKQVMGMRYFLAHVKDVAGFSKTGQEVLYLVLQAIDDAAALRRMTKEPLTDEQVSTIQQGLHSQLDAAFAEMILSYKTSERAMQPYCLDGCLKRVIQVLDRQHPLVKLMCFNTEIISQTLGNVFSIQFEGLGFKDQQALIAAIDKDVLQSTPKSKANDSLYVMQMAVIPENYLNAEFKAAVLTAETSQGISLQDALDDELIKPNAIEPYFGRVVEPPLNLADSVFLYWQLMRLLKEVPEKGHLVYDGENGLKVQLEARLKSYNDDAKTRDPNARAINIGDKDAFLRQAVNDYIQAHRSAAGSSSRAEATASSAVGGHPSSLFARPGKRAAQEAGSAPAAKRSRHADDAAASPPSERAQQPSGEKRPVDNSRQDIAPKPKRPRHAEQQPGEKRPSGKDEAPRPSSP